MELEVIVKNGGKAKTFKLIQTVKPVKGKNGKTTKAVFRPATDNTILMPYGKIYVDTTAK